MFTLIRKLFWCALFVVFTVMFVTLFDHGFNTTKQFTTDAQGEMNDLISIVKPIKRDKDHSDQLPAQ